jgi:glyoxylase I family protein
MQQLRALEERLLNASGRGGNGSGGDEDPFDLLADDFVEFSSSGRVFGREDIIEAIRHAPAPDSTRRTLHDFRVMELGPDVALVTYQALRFEGRERREVRSLRSSLWKRMPGGSWKMVFHQGTRTSATSALPAPSTA